MNETILEKDQDLTTPNPSLDRPFRASAPPPPVALTMSPKSRSPRVGDAVRRAAKKAALMKFIVYYCCCCMLIARLYFKYVVVEICELNEMASSVHQQKCDIDLGL
jgi:hypothetical protein